MCGLTNSPRTCFLCQFTAKSAKDVKQVRVATHDGLLAMSTSAGSTLPAQNCARWEAEVLHKVESALGGLDVDLASSRSYSGESRSSRCAHATSTAEHAQRSTRAHSVIGWIYFFHGHNCPLPYFVPLMGQVSLTSPLTLPELWRSLTRSSVFQSIRVEARMLQDK